MAIQAGGYVTISPAFHEPEILMQMSQPSGFPSVLAEGKLRTRLAEDDLAVYMRQLNLRTKISVGTASSNELPGVDIIASMIQTSTYLQKGRAQYDHHDVTAGGRWGFSTVEAYRLGTRQGHFQTARDAALHGMQPQNGEGILNAPQATTVNLPPDSFGNTTARTYDNGQMGSFMALTVQQLKTRTLMMGVGRKFAWLGPQRTLGIFEYNVVQLTSYQRDGAGTDSTVGMLKNILMKNGDTMSWAYDDTLIGVGPGGTDAIILMMPEVARPNNPGPVNTNEFGNMTPGNMVCATQYCDQAAPREIISPLAGGATDFMTEWRTTSGWVPRPQALTIIYMQY
jgi:hypothetical protein